MEQKHVYDGELRDNPVTRMYGVPDKWGYICPVCDKFVHRTVCWADLDGFQKHLACLSTERLQQLLFTKT